MTVYDSIVIGAGMAGLTAARDLSTRGHSVLLLEARDRIGGRTYTTDAFGGQFDLGGGYVHWTQPAVWSELERHGLAHIEPPLESEAYYQLADGKVHTGEFERTFGLVGKLFEDARQRFPLPWDVTAADNSDINMQTMEQRIDGLGLSKLDSDLIKGALSGLSHDYKKQGSTQLLFATASNFGSYAAELETAGSWCIPGGMTKLSEAIQSISKAELRLSTPVAQISERDSQVGVTTSAGEVIRAKSVVIAVPLNTMRLLNFSPALPEPVQAMLETGNPVRGSKLWVRVRGHITPFTAAAPPGEHPLNSIRVEKRWGDDTLILCMISQSDGIKHDDISAVQAALRKFVPDIEVIDTAWHDWTEDDFSRGGWMMHAPRHFLDGAVEIRKGHGRMSFAGADIAAMGPCTIDGAMSSGAAAARQVERLLEKEAC